MTLQDETKAITDSIMYATLATVSEDGQPWNTPVWSMHDADYTYYWCSSHQSQHSQNIKANGKVFIVVYDSTVPAGKGAGVYIQANAFEITEKNELQAVLEMKAQIDGESHLVDDFLGDFPRRWYKAVPSKIWRNADSQINGNYIDIREEVL